MPTAQLSRARPDGWWPVMASLRHYTTREKAIRAADAGGIRQRWEFGRELLVDDTATTPNGNLRHGEMATLVQAARKAGWKPRNAQQDDPETGSPISDSGGLEREIRYRLQCGRVYPCESQIRQASADFSTWFALIQAGFPSYPAEPGERPYDPRSDAQIAEATGKSGAEILPDGFEQMALFARFDDDDTLRALQRYADSQSELAERFVRRCSDRQAYLAELLKAVNGNLDATYGQARAALAMRDGGDHDAP